MSLPEETKLKVEQLRRTLGDKGFKDKYRDVQTFLETLDQIVAEGNVELVNSACNRFFDVLQMRVSEGFSQSDVDAMKNVVKEILLTREELSEKRNMSKTVGHSSAGQNSPKLDVVVASLTKTTYGSAGKASQHSSGDSKASFSDEGKDVKHKSTISVCQDEKTSAGAHPTQNQDSVVLAQRTKELDETIKERDNLEEKNIEHCRTIKRLNAEKEQMQATLNEFEKNGNNMYAEKVNLEQDIEDMGAKMKDLEKALKAEREQTQKRIIQHDDEIRSKERKFKEREKQLIAERDDLRNRYSKLAGQALKDNNSDISDLSDPNRPMKLGEKFSELYDNEWTDVFQAQMDTLKRSEKESIQVLLSALQECYTFCKQLADKQMDMLRNGFLYHCQDASKPIPSGKDKPRLHSKEEKSLLEVRKMIGANNSGPVKQAFLAHMAGKSDKSGGKAAKEFTAYYEKCTEICWLMALNDPPLYMDMEFKQGAKMDGNLYTPYYTPGDKVDFLVWPPLFNVQKGGLINKGVMAPIQEKRIIKK